MELHLHLYLRLCLPSSVFACNAAHCHQHPAAEKMHVNPHLFMQF